MTPEEAKEMIGTEFVYVFEDGDTIPAYVKMFDPEIGFTCLSLETQTAEGWKPEKDDPGLEEDGTFCVIGYDSDNYSHVMETALKCLTEIKETGKRVKLGPGRSPVSCAFSAR